MLACVSSGLSDFVNSVDMNSERGSVATASIFSIWARGPPSSAASNAVARTVRTLILSFDWTVAIALPA